MIFRIKSLSCIRHNRNIIIKCLSQSYTLRKCSSQAQNKTYSHTILSPKTDFPTRRKIGQKDEIQKKAKFADLYEWQRNNLSGHEFILHDGPPYANGDLHMGHAVNKIIKDITNRSQLLQGNKVNYIPGWDCHGLPIELKALQKAKKHNASDPLTVRRRAREFALSTVERQKEGFKSWGVMADWDKQVYLTLDPGYVSQQLYKFHDLYQMGLIYRALKPVFWSPSSRTALAEAELEYDPQFKSTEIYLAFDMETVPDVVKEYSKSNKIKALIWTTTPWTLLANKAICFNPQMKYCLVSMADTKEMYIVGNTLVESLMKVLDKELKIVLEFDGIHLNKSTYRHCLLSKTFPFLQANHVTDAKGTGLVHTAPAHGPDDFLVALKNNIDVDCNVNESGLYTNLGEYDGLYVLKEGQEKVINDLGQDVLYKGVYTHSYPLDWRTKKPVIIRASQQWFIDTGALKERALNALSKVQILPQSSSEQYRHGFKGLLEKRPYWCISRQRHWGVPIPVLYKGDEVIVDRRLIDNVCGLLKEKGPDVWWDSDVKELVPDVMYKELNLDGKEVRKGQDIMDIWLDSGLSWQTLSGKSASLYSEGVDQLTGWFQAAMLTAIPLLGKAPYESIFVHGFVVDEKKRKMSKSIGNVVDPNVIVDGGTNKQIEPAYGIDTLRWWVASHGTQHSQVIISKTLLQDCQNEIIRIRNILKYLLGVISDLEKPIFNETPNLNYFDQYLIDECHSFNQSIVDHFNQYKFNHVSQTVLNFLSNKVSGLYCHCVKDRLYCHPKDSLERRSAQLVLHTILVTLSKTLAPILPHLIEEAWCYHPLYEKPFFFTQNIPVLPERGVDPKIMDVLQELKKDVIILTKNDALKKFEVDFRLTNELYDLLSTLSETEMCEILEVASVKLENVESSDKWEIEVCVSDRMSCLRCRKYNVINGDKCDRCKKVIESLK